MSSEVGMAAVENFKPNFEMKIDLLTAQEKTMMKGAVAVLALAAIGAVGGYFLGDHSLVNTLIGASAGLGAGLAVAAYKNKGNIGNALKKAAEKMKNLFKDEEAIREEEYAAKRFDSDAFVSELNKVKKKQAVQKQEYADRAITAKAVVDARRAGKAQAQRNENIKNGVVGLAGLVFSALPAII